MKLKPDPASGDRAMFDRRQLLLAALLGGAGATVLYPRLQRQPPPPAPDIFQQATPQHLGAYTYVSNDGLVLPRSKLSDQLYTNLGLGVYSDAAGPPVMLLVAYDQTEERGQLQLHRPEYCYGGAGFTIKDRRLVAIGGPKDIAVAATFWTAVRADRIEQVMFWTRIANAFPTDDWQQNLALIRGNLVAKGVSDAALVRMSIASTDRDGSFARLKNFAHVLAEDLSPAGSRIVFGPAAV